jgi:branched-chain amino acid transport system substrate-binding protein
VRTYRSRPAARAVAAVAGLSLFLTACGAGGDDDDNGGGNGESAAEVEGDTTGVTDTSIKIGTHKPLTGVAAPGYSEIPLGVQAYFDYVNANGGVCDREIEYIVRDDAYNPTQTTQVVNQLVLQDEVFAIMGGLGTPTHSAVIDFLNEEQVPDLFVASGSLTWNDPETYPYSFGWQTDYALEGKVMGQYIAENFPDAKVGLFGQGDDFGRDGFEGAKQFLEGQIVAEQTYTPGNTDVGPQISALQQAGADLVLSFSVPAYTALSQLVSLRLNYQPTWFISNVGSDAGLVGRLLANFSQGAVSDGGGLLDGTYTNAYIPTVETPDDPWIQLFNRVWDENGGDGEMTNYKVYGMSQAYTLVGALVRICDNLNREALVRILEEEGSELEGPWFAPLEYDEDQHRGISGTKVVRNEGGGLTELSGILVTDNADGDVTEYDGEPNEPSEDGIPDAG